MRQPSAGDVQLQRSIAEGALRRAVRTAVGLIVMTRGYQL